MGTPSITTGYRGCLAVLAAAVLGSPPLQGQGVTPTLFESLAVFASKQLKESSGIAVSRRHPGVLWTHNDSGDAAAVYAVDLKGNILGLLEFQGVAAEDWEDIAVGVCPGGRGTCIYVADTGDNRERRDDVSLYITPEPQEFRGRRQVPVHRVVLRYPDGPRDVEALAIRKSGEALLVTKGRSGPVDLYRIDASALAQGVASVDRWTTLDIVPQRMIGRLVTGAALDESDELLAVRTYTQIFFFRLSPFPGTVALEGTCWLGAYEPQGEAVDFLDDSTLVLSSEGAKGRPAGLSRVRCGSFLTTRSRGGVPGRRAGNWQRCTSPPSSRHLAWPVMRPAEGTSTRYRSRR